MAAVTSAGLSQRRTIAKMLQWGRGLMAAVTADSLAAVLTSEWWASMGPRLDGRGDIHASAGALGSLKQLQWGRGLMAAVTGLFDIRSSARGERFNGAAA